MKFYEQYPVIQDGLQIGYMENVWVEDEIDAERRRQYELRNQRMQRRAIICNVVFQAVAAIAFVCVWVMAIMEI